MHGWFDTEIQADFLILRIGMKGVHDQGKILGTHRTNVDNRYRSAERVAERLDLGAAGIQSVQSCLNMREIAFSILRQAYISAALVEKRNAEFAFQFRDCMTQAGLCDMQLFGGLCVVLKFCDFSKIDQLLKIHEWRTSGMFSG